MLHVASNKMGAKAGIEFSRLRKVALKAELTVSHHCPMYGTYRMLGDVRFASTKIYRTDESSHSKKTSEKINKYNIISIT